MIRYIVTLMCSFIVVLSCQFSRPAELETPIQEEVQEVVQESSYSIVESPIKVPVLEEEINELPLHKQDSNGEDYPVLSPDEVEPTTVDMEEEIILLAKMLYGECLGVPSYEEKAACVWVVLNRVDSGYGSIAEVITAPNQFYGYSESNPVLPELYEVAESTLERWVAGYRDLPIEYLWFASRGDGRNYFRDSYLGGEYWEFN